MSSLAAAVADLERGGHLRRIDAEIDPRWELAQIQRRGVAARGPALLFSRVRGTRFPVVCNLFATRERVHYLFRRTLPAVERLIRLKLDPLRALRQPGMALRSIGAAWHMLPRWVSSGPVMSHRTSVDQLPAIVGWPRDGGPFITLPQVFSEDPDEPGWRRSNLGMYRVQLAGNRYRPNEQVGLHYQIHRGIGIHHRAAVRRGEPLRVSIFVGGPPALTVSAVMPLPEGLSELSFAGALAGSRVRLVRCRDGSVVHADADFCLTGTIDPSRTLPEGPFGDHLGYYAQEHEFPYLQVDAVYHRAGAIWPYTSVGRPPQEDSAFGEFIHELTGDVIPSVLPGVKEVHAVDAAGVHPLLLAVGSERYVPYQPLHRPQELLTQANAILGQGQMSLAKYLFLIARQDDETLSTRDIPAFFRHVLRRVDWSRDLHFQTRTTIDTLDYSGEGLNEGSKLVVAAVGPSRRELPEQLPSGITLPPGYRDPRVVLPGVLAVAGPQHVRGSLRQFCAALRIDDPLNSFPLVVIVDDSQFAARSLDNWLWVTFTRSNPAADVDGVEAEMVDKHWGCRGALVIDARAKAHHAPALEEDPQVTRRVDQLAAPGGPLHGLIA